MISGFFRFAGGLLPIILRIAALWPSPTIRLLLSSSLLISIFKTALALALATALSAAAFVQTTPTNPTGAMRNGDGTLRNGAMQTPNGTMRARSSSTDRRMKTKGNRNNGKGKPMN